MRRLLWRDKYRDITCQNMGLVWTLKPETTADECVFWSGDHLAATMRRQIVEEHGYKLRVKKASAASADKGTTIAGRVLLPHDWSSRSSDSQSRLLTHEESHIARIRHDGVVRFNARWVFRMRGRAALEFSAYRASVRALCLLGGSKDSVHEYVEHLVDVVPREYWVRRIANVRDHFREHLLDAIPSWSLARTL